MISAEEHYRRLRWSVASSYADHQLLRENYWNNGAEAAWLIGKPGEGNYLSEVIAGAVGSLLVHGDVDTSRFAICSNRTNAWVRLRWIADFQETGAYIVEKAQIGMSGVGCGEDYYDEVALYDLQALQDEINNGVSGFGDDPNNEKLLAVLEEAKEHVEYSHELYEFLSSQDDEGWDLLEHRFGRIVPASVVIGHMALQRTARLLRDKYGEEGPPECRTAR